MQLYQVDVRKLGEIGYKAVALQLYADRKFRKGADAVKLAVIIDAYRKHTDESLTEDSRKGMHNRTIARFCSCSITVCN